MSDVGKKLQSLINELHDDSAVSRDHVFILTEDGEIVMTKGGELFGLRTLHRMEPSLITHRHEEGVCLPSWFHTEDISWPKRLSVYGCVYVAEEDAARKLRRAIGECWKFVIDTHLRRQGD